MKTLAIARHTMHESFHRRPGLVLLAATLIWLLAFLLLVRFREGQVYFWGRPFHRHPQEFATGFTLVLLTVVREIWTFLALFASAGFVSAYFEKGWVELVFSKPLQRFSVILGSYLAGLALWALSAGTLMVFYAIYFRLQAGRPAAPLLKSLAVVTVAFAVMLAFLILMNVVRPGVALAVLSVYLLLLLSGVLMSRQELAKLLENTAAGKALDLLYYVLPKVPEMTLVATRLAQNRAVESWMPVWSSALFGLGSLLLAGWILERKSF